MKGKGYSSQDGSPPKSSEASYSSTVATTPISQVSEVHDSEDDNIVIAGENSIVPLSILAGISATSISALLVLCVPFPVLIAFLVFVLSSGYMFYIGLMLLAREVQNVVRGGGIGRYLPASIYNRLTETTMHEWMQDTSLTMEYRHLMLYFVPGITHEQLDAYVDALAPRHRRNLRREGLGHFFGEGFMRVLMGDSQYRAHAINNPVRPTELLLPPSQSSVEGDTGSDLGSTTTPELLFSEVSTRGRSMPLLEEEDNIVSRTITVEDGTQDEQEQLQQEESVLAEAMSVMVSSYVNLSVGTVTSTFASVVERVAPYVFATGFGTTAIFLGVGLFGRSYPSRTTSLYFPQQRVLWTTAFIGGFSAGGMFLFRYGVRAMAPKRADKRIEDEKEKKS
jgi:hypothetical protein